MTEPVIPLKDDLRRRVAAARGYANGMSQEKLGKEVGVGRMTIVRTERGDRPDSRREIPVSELREIARATGLSLEFFLTDPADLAAVGPSVEDRLSTLEMQTAALAAIVADALSLEQLEEEQRQFLSGWLGRSSSPGAAGERETESRQEG